MKVLIIGGGGREHAIAKKLQESPRVDKIFVAPGNGGTAAFCENVPLKVEDIQGLKNFALSQEVDYTIVGPEVPLVLGLADVFERENLKVIGPNKIAAQLEGSKAYAKDFLKRHGIITAPYVVVDDYEAALESLGIFGYPMVIKADGLAAGKGVIIAKDEKEAKIALENIMVKKTLGQAGERVVIEKFTKGIEASLLCFVDGETIIPMAPAQDYKKIYDGGKGPNTGGMGSFSPSKVLTQEKLEKVKSDILAPFIRGIKADGIDFKGILFVGLMLDEETISVIEYNVRFGDPETQVVLPRLENDLMDVFEALYDRRLKQLDLKWKDQAALCVVMASGGYPGAYEKGKRLLGLDRFVEDKEKWILHSGTQVKGEDLISTGGRVLNVIALGKDLETAKKKAYKGLEVVSFQGAYYRQDIGEEIVR